MREALGIQLHKHVKKKKRKNSLSRLSMHESGGKQKRKQSNDSIKWLCALCVA